MNHARGYHICMPMFFPNKKDLIIVAAGGATSKVETFSLADKTWQTAQDWCDRGHCFQFLGAQAQCFVLGVLEKVVEIQIIFEHR